MKIILKLNLYGKDQKSFILILEKCINKRLLPPF